MNDLDAPRLTSDTLTIAKGFLLVGSIVGFVVGLGLLAWGIYVSSGYRDGFALDTLGALYIGLGAIVTVGGELGLRAYRFAAQGRPGPAFARALAGALIPPVQLLLLVGAILCKVAASRHARENSAEKA